MLQIRNHLFPLGTTCSQRVGRGRNEMAYGIRDVLKDIIDPEKPQTLEELEVINENDIFLKVSSKCCILSIHVTPTVPHCSLATLIGLSVRSKLEKYWGKSFKIEVVLKEGTHQTVDAVNKQLNDKERIAAAMENPHIKAIVEKCIKEDV